MAAREFDILMGFRSEKVLIFNITKFSKIPFNIKLNSHSQLLNVNSEVNQTMLSVSRRIRLPFKYCTYTSSKFASHSALKALKKIRTR